MRRKAGTWGLLSPVIEIVSRDRRVDAGTGLAACGGDDMMGPGDTCTVGQVLGPEQECSVGTDTFEVMSDGFGCLIEPDGVNRKCSNNEVTKGGFSASNIDDTLNWRIDSMP